MSDINLDLISDLAQRLRIILTGIDAWYDENLASLCREAKTEEELQELWGKVSRACAGPHGESPTLPGLLNVERSFSFDALSERLKT